MYLSLPPAGIRQIARTNKQGELRGGTLQKQHLPHVRPFVEEVWIAIAVCRLLFWVGLGEVCGHTHYASSSCHSYLPQMPTSHRVLRNPSKIRKHTHFFERQTKHMHPRETTRNRFSYTPTCSYRLAQSSVSGPAASKRASTAASSTSVQQAPA